MGRRRWYLVITGLIIGSFILPRTGFAEESLTVEQKIVGLQQQIDILKRQLEVDKEVSSQKAKDAPIVTANAKDGFGIKAQDDSYKLKITGYAQADARFFTDSKKDSGTTSTFLARTVRLAVQGTVAGIYDFYFIPEFGGTSINTTTNSNLVTIPDVYLDARFDPAFKIRAGKFKAPFSIDRLQSTPGSTFAELGLSSNLAPNRDIGVEAFGDLLGGSVNYAAGIFNGVEDAGTSVTDNNNYKELVGRLVVSPFKNTDILPLRGLGIGSAVTYGHKEGTTGSLPTYKTAGQTSFFSYPTGIGADGGHERAAAQLSYYYNSFGLLGEYLFSQEKLIKTVGSTINRINPLNKGWQLGASYVLTGEDAAYAGVVPNKPFSLKDGNWGALELAGRFSTVDIDDEVFASGFTTLSANPTKADAWTLGLNWYLSRNTKLVLNDEYTTYKGGAAGNNDRRPENLVISRFQLSF